MKRFLSLVLVAGCVGFTAPARAQTSADVGDEEASMMVPIEVDVELYFSAAQVLARGTGAGIALQSSSSATYAVIGGIGTRSVPEAPSTGAMGAARTTTALQGAEPAGIASALPVAFALPPARPTPFRGSTVVGFDLPRDSRVELVVYDLRGRHVRTIAQGPYPAGRFALDWSGDDDAGRDLAAGMYFVSMVARDDAGAVLARQVTKVLRLP